MCLKLRDYRLEIGWLGQNPERREMPI